MDDIIRTLREMEDFEYLKGASQSEVSSAETELNLRFANDYKKYLLEYGLASAGGHELTGIVESSRLNVVAVTKSFRNKYSELPIEAYVVEELNLDSIIIFQLEDGSVYEMAPSIPAKKIANSLCEYLGNNTKK
ncbi:SMI1/KNR4 family protein [Butyrivibrio fibrisolvens]|uniref:SMI1/KNR4 family protein n=1 Tax=Butyrivibrio fibrisolvens TaxID=831 RepID=UPI000405857D|nr:SMI1/KNR4 family protein [Butyrivibrio fibrisolvens]